MVEDRQHAMVDAEDDNLQYNTSPERFIATSTAFLIQSFLKEVDLCCVGNRLAAAVWYVLEK